MMKPKPKRRRTWRWVTRHPDSGFLDVWLGVQKPRWNGAYDFVVTGKGRRIEFCCCSEFEKLFGFVPAPGECVKVYFSGRKGR